jgi:hypothetical protein
LSPDQLAGAGAKIEEVSFAEEVFGARFVEDNAGINSRGNLKRDSGRNVGFDHPGNDSGARSLSRDDEVDPRSTSFGREESDGVLNFGGSDLHEVGELIDDHNDVGQAIRKRFFGGDGRGRSGISVFHLGSEVKFLDPMGHTDAGIKRGDIANACLSHVPVPLFHFNSDPSECEKNFFRLCDNGNDEVGKAIVDLEFDDLGVDQNKTEIVWAETIEKAQEESINTDRFARAGCARNEGMG